MSNATDSITDRDTLRAVIAEAQSILTRPARRQAALTYLAQRGINGGALPDEWPLGYAPPGWTRLADDLLARGFVEQELLDAGLARRCSRGSLIDVFRDRIMFPVHDHDHDGQVAGFIGRDLSGAPTAPKYLNTSETPLFSKGTLLYGLHEARAASPQACRPILVEGPLDVLAIAARSRLTGDGRLLPVASCGTAVTSTQAKLIAEAAAASSVPVVVAMDGDTAGRAAALCAGEQLRRHRLDVLVAVLPNGIDPAEYLTNAGNTLRVFDTDGALPLLTVQVQNCIAVQGDRMQWVEGRLAAARNIADILASYLPSYAIAQTDWISTVLDVAPSTFAAALGTAYRDAHALPPTGTRTGDMLRAAANPTRGAASFAAVPDIAPEPHAAGVTL